jgi:hypothetical protein
LLAPAVRRIAGEPATRALGPGVQLGSSQKAAAGTAAFIRDVRTGMADYLDSRRGI